MSGTGTFLYGAAAIVWNGGLFLIAATAPPLGNTAWDYAAGAVAALCGLGSGICAAMAGRGLVRMHIAEGPR